MPFPLSFQTVDSISSFKTLLNNNTPAVPAFFYHGNRTLQVLHTRLRTNCSALAADLYSKNIVDSPNCISCGEVENSNHFFFKCTLFSAPRLHLLENISEICTPTLNVILFGDQTFSPESNRSIFKYVQTFIRKTNRF